MFCVFYEFVNRYSFAEAMDCWSANYTARPFCGVSFSTNNFEKVKHVRSQRHPPGSIASYLWMHRYPLAKRHTMQESHTTMSDMALCSSRHSIEVHPG
jgi:hypothetical protein